MVRLGTTKQWLCYRQTSADNTFHGLASLICVILKEDTQVRALGGVGIINVMDVSSLRIFVVDGDGPDDDQADWNHDYLLVVDEEDREDNSEVDSARHHSPLLLLCLPHPVINKLFLIVLWTGLVNKKTNTCISDICYVFNEFENLFYLPSPSSQWRDPILRSFYISLL